MIRTKNRPWTIRLGLATAVAGLLVGLVTLPGSADSATPAAGATANSGEPVAQINQEVRTASLLRTHGVRRVCPHCDAQIVTTQPGSSTPLSSSRPAGYGPADLRAAYRLPATSSSTATIAILDAGVDGNLANDLATYRSTFGLPACTADSGCLRLENYIGGPQPAPQTAGAGAAAEEQLAAETSLDVDMASAACPSCHLLEISLPWQDGLDDNDVSTGDVATAVNTAVAAGAAVISISYGYTADVTNTHGADLAAFNRKGVAITVSTGDAGFNGGVHQDWPSDLPTVISVGGTTLPASGKETAWTLAGSGCETAFPAATGQPATVTAACGNHRASADISADADPNTGLAVYDSYAPSTGNPYDWTIAGGTSASAPFIGGLFARAGRLAAVNGPNTLYRAPSADFNDITSGNNELRQQCGSYPGVSRSVCDAGPGWDGLTGLGTPHGLGAF